MLVLPEANECVDGRRILRRRQVPPVAEAEAGLCGAKPGVHTVSQCDS
jgi:hypothetical protein